MKNPIANGNCRGNCWQHKVGWLEIFCIIWCQITIDQNSVKPDAQLFSYQQGLNRLNHLFESRNGQRNAGNQMFCSSFKLNRKKKKPSELKCCRFLFPGVDSCLVLFKTELTNYLLFCNSYCACKIITRLQMPPGGQMNLINTVPYTFFLLPYSLHSLENPANNIFLGLVMARILENHFYGMAPVENITFHSL